MRPSEQRQLASIRAELSRLIRYDDESIVHDTWTRQRYDCGCFPGLMAARGATVAAAWHEAGHAVAALDVGAHFSSASIHHGCTAEGRVHGISGAGDLAFEPHRQPEEAIGMRQCLGLKGRVKFQGLGKPV